MNNDTIILEKSKTKNTTFAPIEEKMLIIAIFIIMFCILSNSALYAQSVISGIKLFFFAVLPGLLPFMFLCKILSSINLEKLSHFANKPMQKTFSVGGNCFYPMFMSLVSGYPIGSKITSDLSLQGKIKEKEILICSALSSSSGLIFIIGSVGNGMLNSTKLGIIIYVSNAIATFLCTIILNLMQKIKMKKQKENTISNNKIQNKLKHEKVENKSFFEKQTRNCTSSFKTKNENKNILQILSSSATDTSQSLLVVCFYISFFFVIIDILNQTKILPFLANIISLVFGNNPEKMALSGGIMSGIIEMTRGVKMLSEIKTNLSISLISALISFGGLSIIFQSLSFLSKTNLKPSKFVFAKIVQAFLSFLCCTILLLIFKI